MRRDGDDGVVDEIQAVGDIAEKSGDSAFKGANQNGTASGPLAPGTPGERVRVRGSWGWVKGDAI
jgi:hypothetical protein